MIETLTEMTLIGGTKKVITATLRDSAGVVLDLSGASVSWVLSPEGSTFNLLTKTGVITSPLTGVAVVTVDYGDTLNLRGTYLQQFIVTDSNETTFRAAEGIVTISPAIGVLQ